jgi:peptide/nickel transport system permease protein
MTDERLAGDQDAPSSPGEVHAGGGYHLPAGFPPSLALDEETFLEPRATGWQRVRRNAMVRNLIFNPVNFVGVLIVLGAIFLAAFGSLLAPYSPITPDYTAMLSAPSHLHFFGTDPIGDDIFSRVLAGARLSLLTATAVLAVALVIGLTLGAIAGMAGGWIDEIIMRLTDMFLAFPALILALAIAASLGPGLTSAAIALSMGFWPWYARLLRGQVLSLKQLEYVTAARSLGLSNTKIMWRHILPNALGPIIVELSLDMGYAILSTAALSFIGLGAQSPSPEWGAMIVAGRDYLRTAWWACAFPGIALTLTVLGFNLIGDGLRDALDRRSVRHT